YEVARCVKQRPPRPRNPLVSGARLFGKKNAHPRAQKSEKSAGVAPRRLQKERRRDLIARMFSLTVLGSGSAGNCAVVESDQCRRLIEVGRSARQIVARVETGGV